ncbi:cupin domain-containing protein [Lysobacter sp. SG-8]|uniref:Cupin domain-containing protein n=1 Tax=Marilutibacter penaei TaxID=2759900 RepID=A0A7W3YEL9_9GAMM|nr:ChrR family anti-sigma-E factor [Lysobacter penaei]MBB1088410.1 cupin domain-containing protein [Lysobacter penaei]
MKPHHHLDASTLLGHAAGAMPLAFSAVVEAHLAVCAACRQELERAERVGGALVAQQEGAPLADGARQALLERLHAEGAPVAHAARPAAAAPARTDPDLIPRSLRPYFGERFSGLRWRMIGPGVHHVRAQGVDDGHLMLLRTAPGRSVPMHTHGGNELTMILQGAYDDALGHFAPGDVADLDGDVEHQPVTAPGVPCICVAATDAPLRFSGWIARTLQPLFKL